MKTLYIECNMGAAGDMLTAALLELIEDKQAFIEKLNGLHIPGVEVQLEKVFKCGIAGSQVHVLIDGLEEGRHHYGHPHSHHHLKDIEMSIRQLNIQEDVKKDILAVYTLIAEAEAHVHQMPMEDIHFHEVGTMDAIMDVTAVCLLMYEINPDEIICSPIHVGKGNIHCAHGILPVPAPATAYLLKDIPIYGGSIEGELCTPTGAALLKYFVTKFSDMPLMKIQKVGCGMGQKNFEQANCLRAFLGESQLQQDTETMLQITANVDDMTAEEIGFAMEQLFQAGAHEVFTIPVGMKKSRPGTLLCVICSPDQREVIVKMIFKYTMTIGMRETKTTRYVLKRTIENVSTPYGNVQRKTSEGYGIKRSKWEYDDMAKIAKEKNVPVSVVRKWLDYEKQ